VAQVSTQPLTDISIRTLTGGRARPARKDDNLTAICEPVVYKTWEPRRLSALRPATRTALLFVVVLFFDKNQVVVGSSLMVWSTPAIIHMRRLVYLTPYICILIVPGSNLGYRQ
jgi:hypothetical protein